MYGDKISLSEAIFRYPKPIWFVQLELSTSNLAN
jgi:hypothetical protein